MNALLAVLPAPKSNARALSANTSTTAAGSAPAVAKPRFDRRKSALIVDRDTGRGELRAARLREAGIEVQFASSAEDAGVLLQEVSYDLILLETREDPAAAQRFCGSVLRLKPAQRIAFYVDGPQCISWSPPNPAAVRRLGEDELTSRLHALLGGPRAPSPGSILDAGWRIHINRRLAALKSQAAVRGKA